MLLALFVVAESISVLSPVRFSENESKMKTEDACVITDVISQKMLAVKRVRDSQQ